MTNLQLIAVGRDAWNVYLDGKCIARRSPTPELDAARYLDEQGAQGKATTYRGTMPCLVFHIQKLAGTA